MSMRIACLSTSLLPGSTANAVQLMKVCGALAQTEHEVRLWVPDFGGDLSWDHLAEQYGLQRSFQVRAIPIWRWLRRYDYAAKALVEARRWRADLYYCWPLHVAGMASSFGWPTALELHDRPSGLSGGWWFRRFVLGAGARRLLVTTHALLVWMEQSYPGLQLRSLAQVSPNGVDLAQYADLPQPPAARSQLGLPQQFTVGYTGHLYPGRGVGLLLELAHRQPQISFVLAGGTEADVLARQAAIDRAGLSNVRLLGHLPQSELPTVQAAADVLVMPYQSSITISGGGDSAAFANPMKAAEYLACGRPVLSSDLPVLREVLNDDNALLLPPEDVEAWSAALRDLQQNARARERLSSAARASAAGRSWQARAERALQGLP